MEGEGKERRGEGEGGKVIEKRVKRWIDVKMLG